MRSVVVAALIALVAPAFWFIVTGSSARTPTISRDAAEKMTVLERDAWIEKNAHRESFWEHLANTPDVYVTFWRESIQTSILVFVIVLGLANIYRNRKRT